MNKKFLLPMFLVLGIATILAIGYYVLFSVTVNVTQPVNWNTDDLEQTISDCDSGDTCLGDSITISNDAETERTIKIIQISGDENIEVNYVGKLDLSEKDTSDWSLLGDPTELIYTIVGEEFEYEAELPVGYVLIYYKDAVVGLDGRLENPQPVIEIVSDIGNLPQGDDANLNADYSEAPDNYAHSTGAKLWAVPIGAINPDNTLDWSQMNNFLYETDLVRYFANSDNEITIPANSFITFYPTFTPSTYVESGSYEFEFEIQ